MKIKILEVRDEATFIAVLCVDMNPDNDVQRAYMRRQGYPCDGEPNIALTWLGADGQSFWNDPYAWPSPSRTIATAHQYIYQHWDELEDGSVVDVQFILGERATPKVSELKQEGP